MNKYSRLLSPFAESKVEDDELDLGALWHTLWRGKLWIALSGLIALLLGGYYVYSLAVPVFKATSAVALESREQQVVDIENVVAGLSSDQSTINTEVEVLRSRALLERLVEELDLVNDSEFNPSLREKEPTLLDHAVKEIRALFWTREAPRPAPAERDILNGAVNRLLAATSVANVRQSFVFEISATTEDPVKSATIANKLADLYIDDQIAVKFAKTEQATLWLSDRVVELQGQLEEAQSRLKDFSANTKLVDAEALVGLNRQIKELRTRRDLEETEVGEAEERLATLLSARDDAPAALVAVSNDRLLQRAWDLAEGGDSGALAAFDARAEDVVARARLELARAEAQLAALDRSIEEVDQRISLQSGELVRLQQLEREAEASKLLYEAFLSRLKETSIQQGIQQADSRVLSYAAIPSGPAAPRKARVLALSLIVGLLVGAGGVLLREMMQRTFRTPDELEARTGQAVIGQIPRIPARRREQVIKYLADKPNSAAAEAIRNLRTSMLLANLDEPPQVIMSTSSVPGEGKTTLSLALAQNLSGLGARVLLLEGDIRRRVLGRYFGIKTRPGLLSVLSGEETLERAVYSAEKSSVDVLFGEPSSVNAADLFSSEKFRDFIADLRKTYDYVVIDTPPVLAVPDARVIGQVVDAILYSVKWDTTSHRQVAEGLRAFESVNLRVSGLVLSQINPAGMKRYGYGDRYYYYQSYYEA